jgi:hypothetical protein
MTIFSLLCKDLIQPEGEVFRLVNTYTMTIFRVVFRDMIQLEIENFMNWHIYSDHLYSFIQGPNSTGD